MWDKEIEWIWNMLDVSCRIILPWIETALKYLKAWLKTFHTNLKKKEKEAKFQWNCLTQFSIEYYNSQHQFDTFLPVQMLR